MDVAVKIRTVLSCGLSILFFSCSQDSGDTNAGRKLAIPNGECQAQVIKNSYVVEWESGKVTAVTANSREEIIDKFISPNSGLIKRVEHNIKFRLNAPIASQCRAPGADNWGILQTGAPSAWQKGIYGDGVVVAVIDSGVQLDHPWLENQIFINAGESGLDENGNDKSFNGIDDDNNGYIDDVSGYDFINNSPRVVDAQGHGTHVAGIIAAEHRNTTHQTGDTQGIAPGVKIMPLDFIDEFGDLNGAISAINYAVDNGARIINASWGGNDCSDILRDQISGLSEKNVLFVAAAGNSGNNLDQLPEYPAAFQLPGQITVGAIGPFENMASFSNYSENSVHLFAPGVRIESSYRQSSSVCLDGTSMATPFVAGAAALVLSDNPGLTADEVKEKLVNSVKTNSNLLSIYPGSLSLENIF